jgi:uncharacterized coiled-coil protein SlyX
MARIIGFLIFACAVCALISTTFVPPCLAADLESRLDALEETLRTQQKTIDEQKQVIDGLKRELSALRQPVEVEGQAAAPSLAGGQAATPAAGGQAAGPETLSKVSNLFGGSLMTNPYISFTLNTFYYGSSTDGRKLSDRGIAGFSSQGYDQRKGFNIHEGELYLFAPVDSYFNLYANIPFTDEGGSLEEGYFTTTSLPAGLQVKGGKFKSNFSRLNTQHAHAWDFADLPLAYRAFFGHEGSSRRGRR